MGKISRKAKRSKEAPLIKAKSKAASRAENNDFRSDLQIDNEWRDLASVSSRIMTMYELWVLHYKYRMSKKEMIRFEKETRKIAWLLTHSYDEDSNETDVKSITVTDLEIMLAKTPEEYGADFKPKHRTKMNPVIKVDGKNYAELLARKRRHSVEQDMQNFEIISLFTLHEKWGWKKKKLGNVQDALQKVQRETDYEGYVNMIKTFQKNLDLDCIMVSEENFNVVRSGYGELVLQK